MPGRSWPPAAGDDTSQSAVARVLADLLHRAGEGPPDRVIARTAAAAAADRLPELAGTGTDAEPGIHGEGRQGDGEVELPASVSRQVQPG